MCRKIEKILEIIFPRKCGFCNTLINEYFTCKKCKKKLEYICTNDKLKKIENKYFDYLISSYFYIDVIRNKILEFKFKNKKYLYKSLAEKLLEDLKPYKHMIDGIVSVPISLNRFIERGYNQSELIAKYVAKGLNKSLIKFVLFKTKNNKKQSELGIEQRSKNVQNAYKVLNKKIISEKNLLLIDDIFTTGATINECSKVLKQNGAKMVIAATVAKVNLQKDISKSETKEDF